MARPHTFKHGRVSLVFVMNKGARTGTVKAGDSEIPLRSGGLVLDQVPEEFHEALRELHNQLFSPGP